MQKIFRKPFISIIMNCYNGEKYLKTSIQSLVSQSYKNWELIFWDNKSTDKSKTIFFEFNDNRFKYFKSKKFLKLYEARNYAIEKARGKYICFLDVDDWWTRDKLLKQIIMIRNNKSINFIYSNFYIYNQKKKTKKVFSKNLLPEGKITQKLLDNYSIGILTVMVNKKIIKKKKFNKKFNIIGDFDLFIRLSKEIKFFCIQKPLAYNRFHADNYSNLKLREYLDELSLWLLKIKNNSSFKDFSFFNIILFKTKIKIKLILKYLIGR